MMRQQTSSKSRHGVLYWTLIFLGAPVTIPYLLLRSASRKAASGIAPLTEDLRKTNAGMRKINRGLSHANTALRKAEHWHAKGAKRGMKY